MLTTEQTIINKTLHNNLFKLQKNYEMMVKGLGNKKSKTKLAKIEQITQADIFNT
jgi:hypothetical protein